ncbi:hypothetical protein B0T22DRAFT_439944 [Podospora appendiculata]|uniref:CCHC-type domain-containing protein n=1 Tax=Podospora appendiculata TaxID=314037 RepID=A0AAE1CCC8_9PEZI|nr:hypothetical protein B0T22DRAFT_439944 [Podospora appendiculata]
MDHTDRIRQNLELLGVESLGGLSLDELLHEVDESFPLDISKKRILHVFMAWLNERLMVIDNSDEVALKKEISEWCATLRACSYDDQILSNAFNEFQREQAVVEPSSSRRLNFAWLEIRDFLDNHPPPASPLTFDNPKQEPGHPMMHPDRAMLSQQGDHDSGRVVIDLDDWESDSVDHRSWEEEGTEMAASSGSLDHRAVSYGKEPFNGYVCDRCGEPGHKINHCPTNLDPSFDKRPSKTYTCKLCKSRGDHYLSLCPLNDRRDSITQQRRRAFGSRSPNDYSEGQSQKLEKETQFGLGDNSPPYTGKRRNGDRYRPRDSRPRSRSPVLTRTSRPTRVRDYSRERIPEYDPAPTARSIPLHPKGQNEGRLSFFDDCEGVAESPLAERNRRPGQNGGPLELLESWQENIPRPSGNLRDSSSENGEAPEGDAVLSDMTNLEEFIHQHASSIPLPTAEVTSQTTPSPCPAAEEAVDTCGTANRQPPNPSLPGDGQVMEPEQPLPIVLGVTIKSLDRDPPYHSAVLELFKCRENVWVRKIKRNLATDILYEGEIKETLDALTNEVDAHQPAETVNEAGPVNTQERFTMTLDEETATREELSEGVKTENPNRELQDVFVAAHDDEQYPISQPLEPEILAVSAEKLHITPRGAEEAQFESVLTEVGSLQLFEGEPSMDAAQTDSAMDVDENDVSRISDVSSTTVAAQVDTVMTGAEPLRDLQSESRTEASLTDSIMAFDEQGFSRNSDAPETSEKSQADAVVALSEPHERMVGCIADETSDAVMQTDELPT